MPSITYWNRLEPRPRSSDIAAPLAARVRDPLWFLTRQWQLGEQGGEDAGSPAYVRLAFRETPFVGWRADGGPLEPIDGSVPLEELMETEAFSEHLGLRCELGQLAESLLEAAVQTAAIPLLRGAYPITERTETELARHPDPDEARFLRVVAGRVTDGVRLLREAAAAAPALPPRLTVPPFEVPPASRDAVLAALNALRAEVAALYEAIGPEDAPAWKPERLEYGAEVVARTAEGGQAILATDPGADGDFDWFAFDLRTLVASPRSGDQVGAEARTRSVLPNHVRFRGMPNRRWWAFETSRTDFGAIQPDRRDLAKLLVMDFMLIAGNDWFVAPLTNPVGTLCQIDALVVHDVFGGTTLVPRADASTGPGPVPWTMFSTTAPEGLAPFFILPPTAATSVQPGAVIEEVRFLRDETANMVWGIEHTVQGGVGQALAGQERAQLAVGRETPTPPARSTVPLRYQLETLVPENWIPFLPVAIDAVRGDVALERSAAVRARSDGTLVAVRPRGRVLTPPGVEPYQVREEEVTRAGTRVLRVVCRTRWIDGSTHLWIARRKTVGGGEGSSGLRYDLAKGSGE